MSLQKIFCRSRNNWLLRVTESLAGNVARRQDHPGKRSFLRAARRPWVQGPTRSRQATSAGRPSRQRSFGFWRARFRRLGTRSIPFKAGAQSATHAQLGGDCRRESAKSSAQHRPPKPMSLEGHLRPSRRAAADGRSTFGSGKTRACQAVRRLNPPIAPVPTRCRRRRKWADVVENLSFGHCALAADMGWRSSRVGFAVDCTDQGAN